MRRALLLLALSAACGKSSGEGACGFTNIAGASLLLSEFTFPGQTLAQPPAQLPERLVARLAAGPAYPAMVGRTEAGWVIGVEGTLPEQVHPRYGVLVLDPVGKPRGMVLYETDPMRGAPRLGTVSVDTLMLPLIGIQVASAKYEDPKCPFFPDSVIQ